MKAGDTVKVVGCPRHMAFRLGQIGTLINTHREMIGDAIFEVEFEGENSSLFRRDELMLVARMKKA